MTMNLCACGHDGKDHDVCSLGSVDFPCRHNTRLATHQKRCKHCWCARLDLLPKVNDQALSLIQSLPKAINKAKFVIGYNAYYIWVDQEFDKSPRISQGFTGMRCERCNGRRVHMILRSVAPERYDIRPGVPVYSFKNDYLCMTCHKGRLHFSKSPLSQFHLQKVSKNPAELRAHINRLMQPIRRAA